MPRSLVNGAGVMRPKMPGRGSLCKHASETRESGNTQLVHHLTDAASVQQTRKSTTAQAYHRIRIFVLVTHRSFTSLIVGAYRVETKIQDRGTYSGVLSNQDIVYLASHIMVSLPPRCVSRLCCGAGMRLGFQDLWACKTSVDNTLPRFRS